MYQIRTSSNNRHFVQTSDFVCKTPLRVSTRNTGDVNERSIYMNSLIYPVLFSPKNYYVSIGTSSYRFQDLDIC